MTKTYTEVLEAIQKANPELMKLEIGCRAEFPGYEGVFIYAGKFNDAYKDAELWQHPHGFVMNWVYGAKSDKKILGKEPQLQHVLKATNKSNKYYHGIDSEGYFIQFRVGGYDQIAWKPGYFVHYDLSLPFSQQDESLYTFLHKILCPQV
jgi:hypothetical protein